MPFESTRRFAKYLRMGFSTTYNYVLERSSKYTVEVQQSSTKGGELYVYIFLPHPNAIPIALAYHAIFTIPLQSYYTRTATSVPSNWKEYRSTFPQW